MNRYAIIPTDLCNIAIVASDRGVTGVTLLSRGEAAIAQFCRTQITAAHDPDLLPDFQEQIREYFEGKPVGFDVELDLPAMTPFQMRVLDACRDIPYGQTVTYGELARHIGRPSAPRAVGAALGRNRIPLVIPCHRVVGSTGRLIGFSAEGGVTLKKQLLELEARATERARVTTPRRRLQQSAV